MFLEKILHNLRYFGDYVVLFYSKCYKGGLADAGTKFRGRAADTGDNP